MGKGIALQFEELFPPYFDDYKARCRRGEVRLGKPYLFRLLDGRQIISFPTKDHWRSATRLDDVITGLNYLVDHQTEWRIKSIAVPPLGCGNGQLEWAIVGPELYRRLSHLDADVELYAPYGTPHHQLKPQFLDIQAASSTDQRPNQFIAPWMVAASAILHDINRRDLSYPIGRTAFQKLIFFCHVRGITPGLRFKRGSYGPNMMDFGKLIARLTNNGLVRERRLGKMIQIEPGPTLSDAMLAHSDSLEKWSDAMEAIADLAQRLDTRSAEVIASTIFIAHQLRQYGGQIPNEDEILRGVQEWKLRRRPPLTEAEIAEAILYLESTGWIEVQRGRKVRSIENPLTPMVDGPATGA